MLKSLLSLLLSKFYSKKDAAEIAALALPNHSDGINISITEGTNTYIAPADGYINFITARNGGVNVYGQCLQTNSYPSTNRQAKAFVPISKGKQIIFEIGGETISATFYKLVGGGSTLKKLLLQGGGLCLNSLSSSLRRSSLLVRRSGSLNSVTRHPQTLSSFRFQTIITCILTLHQRTVCLCLGNLVRQELVTWKSSPLVRDLISISQALEFTKVLQCRLIEAKRFLSRQPQITEEIIRSFTSSRLSVKREVGLGGASC